MFEIRELLKSLQSRCNFFKSLQWIIIIIITMIMTMLIIIIIIIVADLFDMKVKSIREVELYVI